MAYSSDDEGISGCLPHIDAKGYTDLEALPDPKRETKDAFCENTSSFERFPNISFSILQKHMAKADMLEAEEAMPAECGKELLE
jgi:hypothetical protein